MVKNHLKRLVTPRSWPIKKKGITFVTKPQAGKDREYAVPLLVAIRDMIGVCEDSREVNVMLHEQSVLVNGKVQKSRKYPVGLFDVITFVKSNKAYRLVMNHHGKLTFIEAEKDKTISLARVTGKSNYKGKIQMNMFNGKNMLMDKQVCKVGDTLAIDEEGKVKEVLELKKGAAILLISGKHSGSVGQLESIDQKIIVFKNKEETFETKKSYAYVVGNPKPVIQLASE